jgi:DNA-binding transcriptional ArsR family regulator
VADLETGAFELFLVVDSPFNFNSFVAAVLSRHLSYFLPAPTTQLRGTPEINRAKGWLKRESRRRDILNYLAMQERSVSEIVDAMEMEQPSVSKHLKVLKGVGLVEVRRDGRQMLYKVNAMAIRPLHEWTSTFERLWKHQLLRIKERAEANNAQKQ